jgi:hypothetical protein
MRFYIFPIDSKPYGMSYGQWSVKWWQWLSSIPKENNPALDCTGANVNVNQIYSDVLFLCQTVEGVDFTPIRRSTISASRAIFIPIINWISIVNEDGNTDEELIEIAKNKMDVIGNLEITINEVTINTGLNKYRARSPFFEIDLPENNIFGLPQGKRRCISDGYWIFLKPIYGDLRLRSVSSCP